MTTKKQGKVEIPRGDVLTSVDERTRAIERTLETMVPPIDDVHGGILRLIAEFAEEYCNASDSPPKRRDARLSPVVGFGVAKSLAYFDLSEDGMTAKRNANKRNKEHFVCTASFSDGKTHGRLKPLCSRTLVARFR